MELVHYGLTRDEQAQRWKKHPSCLSYANPYPVCGNGSYHVALTRDKSKVNCPECLKRV